jgi:hypothetical protein
MFETVGVYLTEHPTQLNSIAEFPVSLTTFLNILKEIKSAEVVRKTATQGKTDVKYAAEEELIKSAVNVALSLRAFGRKKNLPELKSIADVNSRKLERMKDVDLITKCSQLYNEAKKIKPADLEPFGLSAEEIEDLKLKNDSYEAASGTRDSSVATRVGSGKNVIDLINEDDDILEEELDKFVEKFAEKDKTYYDGYQAARVIKNLGVRHNGKDDEEENPPQSPDTPTGN